MQYLGFDRPSFGFEKLGFNESVLNYSVYNLTYDEHNHDDTIVLDRLHSAPSITPDGFLLNGYDTRLSTTQIPSYINNGGDFGFQATVSFYESRLKTVTASEPLVFLGENSGIGAKPTYALTVNQDPKNQSYNYLALEYYDTELRRIPLARSGWRFEMLFPKIDSLTYKPAPQAIHFIDENTLVVTAHYSDTESKAFKINLLTMGVEGEFTFGTTGYKHLSGMAQDASGGVWVADYLDESLSKIDLDQSFLTGQAVLSHHCDFKAMLTFASIGFLTVGGVDYLMAGDYATTRGTLYLVAASKLVDGYTFTVSDSYKHFEIGRRLQGVTIHDGDLYVSRNTTIANSDKAGYIEKHNDIASFFSSATNNSTLAPNKIYAAPSGYPEDCKFRPNTDEFWTMTEGWYAVDDYDNYLAIWSSKLDDKPVSNTITINRSGEKHDVLINSQYAFGFNTTPSVAASALSIGGYPQSTAGMQNGFALGTVRNLALNDGIMSDSFCKSVSSGSHESGRLSVTDINVLQGASNWVNEIGAIEDRLTKPDPYDGDSYLFAGAHDQTIARQRFDISVTSPQSWAIVSWHQSSYTDSDPCTLGFRTIDGSTDIKTEYGGIVWVPFGDKSITPNWFPRSTSSYIEVNASKIDILYRSDRTEGTNNDGYIDAISAVIYAK